MEKERCNVYHNGKFAYSLNEKLAVRQGVTDQEMFYLVELHIAKLANFDLMQATTSRLELRSLASIIEWVEFEMQRNWHFPINKDFHEWYLVPKCTCPRMDNRDRRGTPYRIVNATCLVHGDESC